MPALRAALLVTLVAFVPLAAGIDPSGNDAGSGADAPDSDAGLLLGPGAYSGTLTRHTDETDLYRFEAEAGDVIELSFAGPAGIRFTLDGSSVVNGGPALTRNVPPGGSLWTVLPVSGEWRIRVGIFSPTGPGPFAYSFAFDFDDDASVVRVDAADGWTAFEADLSGASRAALIEGAVASSEPREAQVLYERMTSSSERAALHGWYVRHGGDLVAFGDVSTRAPVPGLPPGTAWSGGRLPLGPLVVRVAQPDGAALRGVFFLAVDGPWSYTTASGSDLVLWDPHEAPTVAAPFVGVVAAAHAEYELGPGFFGVFDDAGLGGNVTGPDGTEYEPLSIPQVARIPVFLAEPPEGRWTFDMPEGQVLAGDPTAPRLVGAWVPWLGVVDVHPEPFACCDWS
ncbi:MAG TPA: hypothetical protein VI997_06190 [Candidatus Thermoplasmatota archaeon]|nr:hypothetical protein [Candidatus Thermoplasmatota archaeon]